ncbi:MAG TPA: alpha/beta family hydrolase [Povalibacter sp.]|jgi:predicted alpha/beta-hydrolase family hydrolase|nr:alpha/beta family hydrolase [Povalibacter sp.]
MPDIAEPVTVQVDADRSVDGLFMRAHGAVACYVFAHGAGAGMTHPSMAVVASELAALGVSTLRYQFPYMQRGSRRPDPPALCHATVRAAVTAAGRLANGMPLIAGGRSFGGRMTSQAQAIEPLPDVRGLAFLAFPLHPAGKPSIERAAHLDDVSLPMLFLQGTCDELADMDLLQSVVDRIGARATLRVFPDADHSFHVPARTGQKDADVRARVLRALVDWCVALPA